jgi:hypothetical protein
VLALLALAHLVALAALAPAHLLASPRALALHLLVLAFSVSLPCSFSKELAMALNSFGLCLSYTIVLACSASNTNNGTPHHP